MLYATTITCNKQVDFETDKATLEAALAWQKTAKDAIPLCYTYEVQPAGRHLLHLHGIVSCDKLPFFPQGKQKQMNVNVMNKEVYYEIGWKKYSNKSNDKANSVYKAYHGIL